MGVELRAPGFRASRLLAGKFVCASAAMLSCCAAFAQPTGLTPCLKGTASITCSGTFRFPDGVIYSGEFRDGRRHGVGAFVFPDGRRQVHEFELDVVTGRGIRFRADGSIESSGTFLYGQLVRAHPVDLQIFDRRPPIPSDPTARQVSVDPLLERAEGDSRAFSAMTADGRSLSFVLGTSSSSGSVTGLISIFDIIDVNGRSSIRIIPRTPG